MKILWFVSLFILPLALPVSPKEKRQEASSVEIKDADMVHIDNFYIDKYEYPNRKGVMPQVDITWTEARDLCRARGKRLCSEREWEKACRGSQNQLYGYGPTFEQGLCNTPYKEGGVWNRGPGATPSGEFTECASDYGVYDMIGNVWEWTDGWYIQENKWRVVRGGSWFHSVNLARADSRYGRFLATDYRLDLIGLRCCRSASEEDQRE